MRTISLYHSFLLITVFCTACQKKQYSENKIIEERVSVNSLIDMEGEIYPSSTVSISDTSFINMDREIYSNKTTKYADKSLILNYDTHVFEIKDGKIVRDEFDRTPSKTLLSGVFSIENNIIICKADHNQSYKLERLTAETIRNYDMPYLKDTLYIIYKKLPKEKHPSIVFGHWENGKKNDSWLIFDGEKRSILHYENGVLIDRDK